MTRLRLPPPEEREDGQVLLLSLGFAVLAILLIVTVVSATAVHLERKRLLVLADHAALAAAAALDEGAYYGRTGSTGDAGLVLLTPSSVRSAAEAHVTAAPEAGRFSDLRVAAATTGDGRTAEVTLTAVAHPPLLTWATAAWDAGVPLQVTSRARAG